MYTVHVLEGAIWKIESLFVALKVRNHGIFNSFKKQMKLTVLSRENAQDSEILFLFLRKIEELLGRFTHI